MGYAISNVISYLTKLNCYANHVSIKGTDCMHYNNNRLHQLREPATYTCTVRNLRDITMHSIASSFTNLPLPDSIAGTCPICAGSNFTYCFSILHAYGAGRDLRTYAHTDTPYIAPLVTLSLFLKSSTHSNSAWSYVTAELPGVWQIRDISQKWKKTLY
jgi:hypothetical protein